MIPIEKTISARRRFSPLSQTLAAIVVIGFANVFPKGFAALDFGRVLLTTSEPASILEGVRNAYFAVRGTAEEDYLMGVTELQRQMDACKKDLTCRANVERFFISTGGKITVQPGGKVFVDQTGGKVFIPNS